jgi:GTPase
MPTAIKSIQRKRVNVNSCEAGQSVTFALKRIRRNQVRKGMAVIAKTDGQPPKGACTVPSL